MGILREILGGGGVIKAGFDLIDDIHTSDVELIEAKADAKVKRLEAYAPFKVAQRLLALMFAVTFLACFVMVLTCVLFGWGNPDDIREVMQEFYIAAIMFTIVGFYFGGGMLEGALKARNGKA
jgi:hypothetical protein